MNGLTLLLPINAFWLAFSFTLQMVQGMPLLNPDGNPFITPNLAFNVAISFVVNTGSAGYSGEG